MRGERDNENPTRKRLSEHIQKHPGISFQLLTDLFGLKRSTMNYHLGYLVSKGIVTKVGMGQDSKYYSEDALGPAKPGTNRRKTTINQDRVIKVIRANPGITRERLKGMVVMPGRSLSYTLSRLLDRNIIWEIRKGDEIGYDYITRDKVLNEMLIVLSSKFLSGDIDEGTFLTMKKEIERKIMDL